MYYINSFFLYSLLGFIIESTLFKNTILTLFNKKNSVNSSDKESISQFQTFATALAATMGTGNIVGVATALTIGGAGAIFWMWISAILGMALVILAQFTEKNPTVCA